MIKLVAIGNRFMKDDGISIEVAEVLKDSLCDHELEIIIGETDFQSSLCLLRDDDFVILLDAFHIGSEPGSIHIINLEDALLQPSDSFMQHEMSMIEFMKLYNCKFRGYIIGIEVIEIGFGKKLSPILKKKFPQICSEVKNFIINIELEVNKSCMTLF